MKKINVVKYDTNWPNLFKIYADEIEKTLGQNCIKIYHVGSTSVPGLCAKPAIDIMCVVKNLNQAIFPLESIGYIGKGEFNLPMRLFFSRKALHNVHIHVVKENSGEIEWNLCFQNYLRSNKKARDMYADVKNKLLLENPNGFKMVMDLFSEYTIKKGDVILKIAKMANFSGYRFVMATNYNETKAYKKLMNLNEINFKDPNIFHLCLYKGTEIPAVACVEFSEDLSNFNIKDVQALNNEYKQIILEKIQEWAEFKLERNILKLK